MSAVSVFVKRHPLVAFFALAYALTWPTRPPSRKAGPA